MSVSDFTACVLFGLDGLSTLIDALRDDGYEVVGPSVREGVVDYEPIDDVRSLPIGLSDTQTPGTYRLEARSDEAAFQYASTAQSWKRLVHPPVQPLLTVEKTEAGLRFVPHAPETRRVAFLGARSCDLHAMRVLEQALTEDPEVRARRERAFVVATHCGRAVSTCFCTAMGPGPRAEAGYDLALTELLDGSHRFLVEVGTERGRALLARITTQPAEAQDLREAERAVETAVRQQEGQGLDPGQARETLLASLRSPHWDEVAEVCTACGACTMVCPTCFCSTVVDSSDVNGESATRTQVWDSCFSEEFSYISGGSVRASTGARYRQWITHKLAHWPDQFDTSGCVGCGRCITWCPVGIDIRKEASHHGRP